MPANKPAPLPVGWSIALFVLVALLGIACILYASGVGTGFVYDAV